MVKKSEWGIFIAYDLKFVFNKCEPSNRMWIEDSNKDNYNQFSEQLNHKCTYNIRPYL